MLPNIRIVLVNPSHPGNVGAAARAMKTMGLSRLHLVEPHDYPSAEATARASGADDVLADAAVFDDLDAALAGCGLVIGTSARSRTVPWPVLGTRECARRAIAESRDTEVAVVFGREKTGLSNEELDRCHFLVHIPTDEAYSSLNLAAAVQVIAYELRMAALDGVPDYTEEREAPLASADEMAGLYRHLESTLHYIGFLNPEHPRRLMRRLRRLFNRARPDQQEINILRGILSAVQDMKPPRD
jgi:tRNA (cytidine32/uridine32-2'-O)-methyltransferase